MNFIKASVATKVANLSPGVTGNQQSGLLGTSVLPFHVNLLTQSVQTGEHGARLFERKEEPLNPFGAYVQGKKVAVKLS